MDETSRLRQMILRHWQEHRPQMMKELREHNQLENTLRVVEERTADLLYELISVQKLDYQKALELATREWAFLPTEDRQISFAKSNPSQNSNPPATSE